MCISVPHIDAIFMRTRTSSSFSFGMSTSLSSMLPNAGFVFTAARIFPFIGILPGRVRLGSHGVALYIDARGPQNARAASHTLRRPRGCEARAGRPPRRGRAAAPREVGGGGIGRAQV